MTIRNFYKLVGVLLSATLCVSLLASCGSTGSTGASSSPSTAKEDAPKAVTLSLWHCNTAEVQHKLITDSIARFQADHPGVTITDVPVASDAYETKLAPAIGSGTPPDIFITWSGGKLFTYVDAGKIADLTGYMAKDNYSDKFLDGALSQATYQDKLWGVPVENTTAAVFFYDKELFVKNNITPPATWSELMSACEAFKAQGIAPFALGNKFQWPGSMYYMYLALRLGGEAEFAAAANRTGGSFASEPFVKAYEMLQDCVDKGYFNDGYNSLDNDAGQPKQLLYSGKAAMYLMGTWEVEIIKSENPEFYERMGVFPFPSVEGGKGDSVDAVGTLGDNFYSISETCENKDLAFSMIQYLIDEQSTQERIDSGKIPPLKGVTVSDPIQQDVLNIVSGAEYVQLWYDQYFPADIATAFLDANQAAFGKNMTPQEAAQKLEDAVAGAAK